MKWWTLACALAASAVADPIVFNQDGISSSTSLFQNGSAVDVRMQVEAPLAAGWSAVGMGSQMQNSLMFVMYPSASGQAVTVSPRTAPGHVMPRLASGIMTQVLNSSVNENGNGMMMADFVCYSCTQWPTGTLSTTSSSQPFVFAIGPGGQAGSDDPNAMIKQHTGQGMFSGNAANAFTTAADATAANSPQSTAASGNVAQGASESSSSSPSMSQIYAHAVLMCLVFFGFMPTAVILLRLPFMGRAAFQVHWMIQTVAFFAAVSAMGIAINFSKKQSTYKNIDNYHQIIGITLTSVIVLQAAGGALHHVIFKKKQRRTAISYGHITLGWMIITLGMLNGCFGLHLVEKTNAAIGLGVAGIVILAIMLTVSLWAGWRRRMSKMPEKREDSSQGRSPQGSDFDQKERMANTYMARA